MRNFFEKGKIEAGCDEAGRGCLAGPVVAAAVILPQNYFHPLLNDSKKISPKTREILEADIKEKAWAYSIGTADNLEIDKINILNATFLSMHRAIESLPVKPELLLIDGNRFRYIETGEKNRIPHKCFIKGDAIFASIAAASVLAKTFRDRLMHALDKDFPAYGWKVNKGYATLAHRNAIALNGMTALHRKSFSVSIGQLKINC